MKKTLMPDEAFVAEARFHKFYVAWSLGVFALWLAAGGGVHYLLRQYVGISSLIPVYAGLGMGGWMLFWMMLKEWTTEIILTDKRLLYKRGFFQIKIDEVDIEQLASDNVEQSLLGRMMDYGAIHIRCIEASDIRLPPVAQPYDFRNALEKTKHHYREKFLDVGRLYRHSAGEAHQG